MAKGKKKRPSDINVLASQIVAEATGEEPTKKKRQKEKNPAAVALGRLGGLKGGPAKVKKMSKDDLRAWGQKAAKARWAKKKSSPKK